MRIRFIAGACAALFTAGIVSAAELTLKPGLWETTMTSTNPMMAKPMTQTSKECLTGGTMNPESLVRDVEDCKLLDSAVKGDTLSFSMECNMQGNKALITGSFQTSGDTASSNVDMDIEAAGMKMNINMKSEGKRLGDC